MLMFVLYYTHFLRFYSELLFFIYFWPSIFDMEQAYYWARGARAMKGLSILR